MSARILAVCGTTTHDSRTLTVIQLAAAAAREAGAEVQVLDLAEFVLPLMVEGDAHQAALPEVQRVRTTAAWANGFIIGSPEYHGSMSGALKNWFDYLWQELAGKVAGVVAVTSQGHADKAITTIKTCFQWCHGWTLPFHAAATWQDFSGDALVGERVRDRLQRIGHDVARYAPLVHGAFDQARTHPSGAAAGFAGLHAR